MSKDYYKILKVERNATAEEIKKSYRKLALLYHPDKNPGDKTAESNFREIAEAYEILSNPNKKMQYDSGGSFNTFFNSVNSNPFSKFTSTTYWEDIFKNRVVERKGQNLFLNIPITIYEMYTGTKRSVKSRKYKKCKSCEGNGSLHGKSFQTCYNCKGSGNVNSTYYSGFAQVVKNSTCTQCNGTGKMILEVCEDCLGKGAVIFEEIIDIDIPKGSIPGIQISIPGKGNEEPGSTSPGDLMINIKETIDPYYERQGTNVKIIKDITFIDACIGTNIDVKLPLGEIVSLVVDPGTLHGTILQLAGRGLYEFSMGSTGDFLVEIHIKVPKVTNSKDIEILEKLRKKEIFKL